MIIQTLEALAQDFWAGLGGSDTFPRDIEQAAPLQLPLAIIQLAPLTLQAAIDWLRQRGIAMPMLHDTRYLHGCLVAHYGRGFIFVSTTDGPEERRLTVAHEVAHFLADYLLPRRQVMQALGAEMAAVLDGSRPPTPAERAAAILSHLRLGAHIHLLPRPEAAVDNNRQVIRAEACADRLALALVAPQACIHRVVLETLAAPESVTTEAVRAVLATFFGVPAYVFDDCIQSLVRRSPPSFVEDIRAGLRQQR